MRTHNILMMGITRTFDLLERYQNNFTKEDVFAAKEQGTWVKYSTELYIRNSHLVAYGLLTLGIQKGDRIVTVTNNRPLIKLPAQKAYMLLMKLRA